MNQLGRLPFKVRRYMKVYQCQACLVKYSDPTRRIRSNDVTATGQ